MEDFFAAPAVPEELTELLGAFKDVFRDQPIAGIKKKNAIKVVIMKPDPTGGLNPQRNEVELRMINNICTERDNGTVIFDWSEIKSSAQLEIVMAIIYGTRENDTFTHFSENLYNGWLNVLQWGKKSKNVKANDVRSLLMATSAL